jgi:hypothetical protein
MGGCCPADRIEKMKAMPGYQAQRPQKLKKRTGRRGERNSRKELPYPDQPVAAAHEPPLIRYLQTKEAMRLRHRPCGDTDTDITPDLDIDGPLTCMRTHASFRTALRTYRIVRCAEQQNSRQQNSLSNLSGRIRI